MSSSSGGRFRKILRVSGWLFTLGIIGGTAAGLGVVTVIYAMVFFGDDSHFSEEAIKARITEETAIYMLDEQRKIGSFFDSSHRTYIQINEIPAHMINAIIASEDKNFYEHSGVDPVAIVSAGLGALKGGRIRGASTLTQQTVRNILGWWEVTVSRKFKEWIAALQLERRYDKRQILEFYLNQFYVSGNGNGIGIAAKYYFNKDVRDLDLVESAFIAGSVKGPSLYDPFIKYTKERQEKAVRRAFHRKNYVLKRMFEQDWIDEEQYLEAKEKPVKFNRGRFRSTEVALTQVVKKALENEEILDALAIENTRDIAGAGFKVFTTIDGDLQDGAQLAMRRNLSRLETILQGYEVEKPERFKKLRSVIQNEFYYAQVGEIGGTKEKPQLELTFGLPVCTVPYESLMRKAKIVDLPFGRGWEKQLQNMMKDIKVGDVVFVELVEYDTEKQAGVCELQRRPRVNGGMIAIDKGEVRAVVSGFDTKGFNRAVQAKRQPGSVFKPVVFFAGLQLGWSILDRLDNQKQVFPFQGKFYYPQPDHQSPYNETSILWAGIMSENLASISLASRMIEKLNFSQFKELMGHMGLLPESGESTRDYHYRVAKKVGVQLDNEGVREYQLRNAAGDLLLDVQYTSSFEFQSRLAKLWWGRGYSEELQAIFLTDSDDLSAKRRAERIVLVKNNYLRLKDLSTQLATDWQVLQDKVSEVGYESAFYDPAIQHLIEKFRVLPGVSSKPVLGYYFNLEKDLPVRPVPDMEQIDKLLVPEGRMLNPLDMQAIWGGNVIFGTANISLTDVTIDGWMPYGYMQSLGAYLDQHYAEVTNRQEDYDLHRYYQHHDFRIALGLQYVVEFTKAMGVESKLEPVLSYPLGTNEVTVAEVAKIYQTFISGKTYKFFENGPENQLNFIRRIEDRYGNTLYEPERQSFDLVKREFALQMREILRRIVTHGTGRAARGELHVALNASEDGEEKNKKEVRVRIPAFGKTGTTNDYTNAYFAGFFPYPTAKNQPIDPENAYVISAYVGYDLNRPMRNGYKKISGASGALPAWINLAKAAIDKKKYNEYLDTLDINVLASKTWPLHFDTRATPMQVDMPRGVAFNRREVGEEMYALTDIDREGESDFNEFRASVVKGTIYLPLDDQGAGLRVFAPFQHTDPDAEDVAESKVEANEQKLSNLMPTAVNTTTKPDTKTDGSAPTNSADQTVDSLFGPDDDDQGQMFSPPDLPEQTEDTDNTSNTQLTDPDDIFGDLNQGGDDAGADEDEFEEEELW